MRDARGNALPSSARFRTPFPALGLALLPLLAPGELRALPSTTIVIQQVEADAPAGGTDTSHEWLELRNVSAFEQTLVGWTLADNVSPVTLPRLVLPPACSVLVVPNVDTFDADHPGHVEYVVGLGLAIGSGLSNSGDRLQLKDAGAAVVDCMSYGTDVGCLQPAPAAANAAQTLQRFPAGIDTDASGDWVAAPPVLPGDCEARIFVDGFETADRKRWSNPDCGLGTFVNETDVASEVDYCNVQFPLVLSVGAGQDTGSIFGQIYNAGVTPDPGPHGSVLAELGYGPSGSDPRFSASMCAWTWIPAAFNTQIANNDEYFASFLAPAVLGSYSYAFRFSLNGTDWTLCDTNGAGTDPGLTFSASDLGVLNVN